MDDYKGYTVYAGEVYKGKQKIKKINGKHDIDGEQMTVWELMGRIGNPEPPHEIEVKIDNAPRKEKADKITPHESKTKPVTATRNKVKKKPPHETKHAGETNSKFEGWFIVAGKEYATASEAAKIHKKRTKTLIEYCKLNCSFRPK